MNRPLLASIACVVGWSLAQAQTVPPPAAVAAAGLEKGKARIVWQPPAGVPTSSVRGYRVLQHPGTRTWSVQANKQTLDVTGLKDGMPYTFGVQSRVPTPGLSSSAWSEEVSIAQPITSQPTITYKTNVSGFCSAPLCVLGREGHVRQPLVITARLGSKSVASTTLSFQTYTPNVTPDAFFGEIATADQDYVARSGTVLIPAGQQVATITLETLGDRVVEPDESFMMTIVRTSGPDQLSPLGDALKVTIKNDD